MPMDRELPEGWIRPDFGVWVWVPFRICHTDAKVNPESRVSAARPNVGRRFGGSSLYCDNYFRLREDSGVTPAKPVRVPKTPVSADVRRQCVAAHGDGLGARLCCCCCCVGTLSSGSCS